MPFEMYFEAQLESLAPGSLAGCAKGWACSRVEGLCLTPHTPNGAVGLHRLTGPTRRCYHKSQCLALTPQVLPSSAQTQR